MLVLAFWWLHGGVGKWPFKSLVLFSKPSILHLWLWKLPISCSVGSASTVLERGAGWLPATLSAIKRQVCALRGYEWEPQSVGLLPCLRLSLIHLGVPGPSTPSTAVLNEQALAELSILDWLLGVAWTPATSEKLGAPSKEVCFVPKSPKGFWSKSSKLFLNWLVVPGVGGTRPDLPRRVLIHSRRAKSFSFFVLVGACQEWPVTLSPLRLWIVP